MSDLVKKSQADHEAKKQPSEVAVWLGALACVAGGIASSSSYTHFIGSDLGPSLSSRCAAGLGLLLAWGVVHAVSQRREDMFLIGGCIPAVCRDELRQRAHLANFAVTFGITLFAIAATAVLMRPALRYLARWSPKAPPPQSDHLLYDAEVDAGVRARRDG